MYGEGGWWRAPIKWERARSSKTVARFTRSSCKYLLLCNGTPIKTGISYTTNNNKSEEIDGGTQRRKLVPFMKSFNEIFKHRRYSMRCWFLKQKVATFVHLMMMARLLFHLQLSSDALIVFVQWVVKKVAERTGMRRSGKMMESGNSWVDYNLILFLLWLRSSRHYILIWAVLPTSPRTLCAPYPSRHSNWNSQSILFFGCSCSTQSARRE